MSAVESLVLSSDETVARRCASMNRSDRSDLREVLIRLSDITISVIALVCLLPVMVIVAVMVRSDGGSAIFSQVRVGKRGELFYCLKFRTMAQDAGERLRHMLETDPDAEREWAENQKLRRDPRITRLGRLLRTTSLDELPQLLNVIRGEMSLVGPRPVVPEEIARYGRCARYYYRVRPGLTGLWQVQGRNDVSYRRRVALDRTFVKSRSVKLYFTILVMTVPAVLGLTGQ